MESINDRPLSHSTSIWVHPLCGYSPVTVPVAPIGIGAGSSVIEISRIRSPDLSGVVMAEFLVGGLLGLTRDLARCRPVWCVWFGVVAVSALTTKRPHVTNVGRFRRRLG